MTTVVEEHEEVLVEEEEAAVEEATTAIIEAEVAREEAVEAGEWTPADEASFIAETVENEAVIVE